MEPVFIVGIIIFSGVLLGELAERIHLPKISGYIVAGLILNPEVVDFIPENFAENTGLITDIALSFITFSVGGTLLFSKIKKLGKSIFSITVFESELAFLFVVLGMMVVLPFFVEIDQGNIVTAYLPVALLLGSLASPTDPSSTLAVMHEYKAKGSVSSTIMGIAAFDDALGVINYSIAIAIAATLSSNHQFSALTSVLQPIVIICLSIVLGIIVGIILNFLTRFVKKETDGVLIVQVLGLLLICFGLSSMLSLDALLSTMSMGMIVVNFNPLREKIFGLLQRYIEEIIFVLFFVLAGMHLDFSVLSSSFILIGLFVFLRALGKYTGIFIGAGLTKTPQKVRKYTFGGVLPQGGIVIGLALMIRQNPSFQDFSDTIIGVIIGATIIHELIGPLSAKLALKKANELYKDR
ncbi:MAG: cation:proton antiporter [Bacteroidales bacterium]|jgi:Kef-type K+ transport system membrane component KefB|nr:cation:proton antiporter [Bacteroidales bacterium]